MHFPFNAFVVDYPVFASSIWLMFCINLLFESGGQSVGGIRRLSAVMSVLAPLLEGPLRRCSLNPGFAGTLGGALSSDVLIVRDDYAVLIRR